MNVRTVERDWDAIFARVSGAAAETVAPHAEDKSFLEKRLAAAFSDALESELAPTFRVSLSSKVAGFELPNWDPVPGWFDVAGLNESEQVVAVAELKLDDVDQTLWDIFKVAAALEIPSVEAGYVIACAPPSRWASNAEVVELFDDTGEYEWLSRYFFDAYARSWAHLLKGGKGRPTTVPDTSWMKPIARASVRNFADELRAVRIQASRLPLGLRNGWPVPKRGEIADDELTSDRVPVRSLREDEIHRFALTTNGFERMGSFKRCADLANNAIKRWRENGDLPKSLRDLRCCLFFEQRRWHHFGYGFDEETLRYAMALVEAIGAHVSR